MKISVREIVQQSKQESTVDLGSDRPEGIEAEKTIGDIQDIMKASTHRVFEVKWTGGRVPRGAKLCGKTIEFARNGFIYDATGKDFATYDRIEDMAGDNKDRHSMIVHLYPEKDDLIVN